MRVKRLIPILLVGVVVAAGACFLQNGLDVMARLSLGSAPESQTVIRASGIIESDDTKIAAVIGGRVLEVLADEGDEVEAGELLVSIDPTQIDDQIAEARAGLRTAQANLQAALIPVRAEEIAIAKANVAKAQAARDGAARALQHAIEMRDSPLDLDTQINETRAQAEIAAKQIETAQAQLAAAEAGRDHYQFSASDEDKTLYQVYLHQVDAARAAIAAATTTQQGMQQQLEDLEAIRANPVALTVNVNAARSQLELAEQGIAGMESELALLQAGPRQEDVNIAGAQVALAQAIVDELLVQRDKLSLYSPVAGVVAQRTVDPGEIAVPEKTLLTIDDLGEMTLTLYVPETEIGQIGIGQAVDVSVDAVPGQAFAGVVTYIASEAEFTPKNVQTQRERANTVFAVKVALPNPAHMLKPGVPADADIHLDRTASEDILIALRSTRQVASVTEPTPTASSAPLPSRMTPVDLAASPTPAPATVEPVATSTPLAATRAPTRAPAPTPTATVTVAATPAGRIVYATQDGTGKYDLWVSAVADSAPQWVASNMHQPDVRADGLLVTNGAGPGTAETLLTLKLDGSDIREVSLYDNDVSPKWSPDGARLLFVNEQVGELDVQDGPDKQARRLPIYFEINPLLGRQPAWLDDDHVVYQGCDVWQRGTICGLYAAQVSGGVTPWRIVDDTHATAPSTSAGRVAYMSDTDGNWDIYLLDGKTPAPIRLTADPAADGLPVWSPDGEWLAFLSNRGGSWAVWAVHPRPDDVPVKLFDLNGSPGADWTSEQLAWMP